MRFLLIGATGQVGTDLRTALAPHGDVVATTRSGMLDQAPCETLDVTDLGRVTAAIRRVAPDVVVNAAAYTAVDRAESEQEAAHRINAEAPAAMAAASREIGARFVHYSTDYVFDGRSSAAYGEDDPTAPQGAYGATKEAGERAVRSAHPDALILRTAWVYALHGSNFLRTMLRLGAEREELRVVADQVGCPTPGWLIAETTARVLASDPSTTGTFHLVTRGRTSWHGFAEAIFAEAARHGLIQKPPRVVPIRTEEYPTPARRPAFSVLDPSRIEALLGSPMPDWRSALATTFERD